jgi:hypothetical protein
VIGRVPGSTVVLIGALRRSQGPAFSVIRENLGPRSFQPAISAQFSTGVDNSSIFSSIVDSQDL